ncbi:MAG: MoxR family ATPase [Brevundimonas sp.]|uniref:AAA family ATPase n=1 Tax=Brevundimonas sp. TaxID=1871086 RepID=UPI001A322C32|nr:MoxR family ATPase [Brevundimonas sp.]MBJ7447065.1 MoxR family ATPase [Brevundimonas sp.]
MDVAEVGAIAARIRSEVAKAVIGQTDTVDLMLTALFSGGHILLEGPPGTAKTLLAQSFARTLSLQFGRIQFTPDLMPGDILGSNLFNFQTSTFSLTRGPVFCDLLLADEINRTPPKTQAALLEAMQERSVTIDGETHALSDRFTVIATQNPIEQQGVYPLPEAQLDRFLFKQTLDYLSREDELKVVKAHGSQAGMPDPEGLGVTPIADQATVAAAVQTVSRVRLSDEIAAYVVDLIRSTRENADLQTGASPRAGSMLAVAARARAVLDGRDYVIPDDVKGLALPALRHKVVLSAAAEIEGRRVDQVIASLIDQVPAPR